jgi:hypothetical protein
MAEKNIQDEIRLALGSRPDIRVFRNNVGQGFQGVVVREADGMILLTKYRRIAFGLMPGSGDLIGWKSRIVTPDMINQSIAVFASAEVKRPGEKPRQDQINWALQVRKAGGIAGIVHNAGEALALVGEGLGL